MRGGGHAARFGPDRAAGVGPVWWGTYSFWDSGCTGSGVKSPERVMLARPRGGAGFGARGSFPPERRLERAGACLQPQAEPWLRPGDGSGARGGRRAEQVGPSSCLAPGKRRVRGELGEGSGPAPAPRSRPH